MKEYKVGARVRSLEAYRDVPKGTEGVICEDYGSGVMVAWDLPDRPLPDLPMECIARMYAVIPQCPLRDGFDKKTELQSLELIE